MPTFLLDGVKRAVNDVMKSQDTFAAYYRALERLQIQRIILGSTHPVNERVDAIQPFSTVNPESQSSPVGR